MPALSAIRLADALRLAQGPDALPARLLSTTEMQPAFDIANQHLHTESEEERTAFFDELAALYLPCLLRTYFNLPLSPYQDDRRWYIYEAPAQRVCDTAALARFVREQPEEACGFFLTLIKSMTASLDAKLENPAEIVEKVLRHLAGFFISILLPLISSLPQNVPLPSLEEKVRRDFVRVVVSLRRNGGVGDDEMVLLESFARGAMKVRTLDQRKEEPGVFWWICELKGVEETEGSVQCVEGERGKEMDACSRCLSVRYCSKEHQKLD